MTHKKAVPDYGEGGGGAAGRGKCEQTQKNDSNLCTPTCPYRLARLGTSLRVRGKLTLRKKGFIILYLYTHLCVSLAGFFAKSHMIFFSCHHSDSAHRSRMTAAVNCVLERR